MPHPRGARASGQVTLNTVYLDGLARPFSPSCIGFGAALVLNREFIGRGLLRGMLLIPYVISAVAAAYVWRWLYHSDFGVIGALAVQLGFTDRPINFLDNRSALVMPSLIVVNVWKEFSVRDDHDAGRSADRARSAAARGAGRRRERLAALLARHRSRT